MSQNLKTLEELKMSVKENIDNQSSLSIDIAKTILENPEPGFREYKTSQIVKNEFEKIGLKYEADIALTGVKAKLSSGKPGPNIAVIGELDSLIVKGHKFADSETLAAHACGHHCQIAMMLGVAMALKSDNVKETLSGRIALMAVPAEEYIEIEYRDTLRRQGKIEFLGGKQEFISRGSLDDVDIAMMTHTASGNEEGKIAYGGTNNGIVAKRIRFSGKAAHAGGAPHTGINALNAANIAFMAIHAQRETFRDEDTIRVHPIITQGGIAVSSVPADVRMETFVRGKTIEAFLSASKKVDRALRAGALAVGGSVTITTLPGYLPIRSDEKMLSIYKANAADLVGDDKLMRLVHRTGSTDMGDVSQIMPVIHPYVGAATGNAHGSDYIVKDYNLGVLIPAKAMAMTVIDLLYDGAKLARNVKSNYVAPLDKKEYLSLMRGVLREDTYTE